MMEQDVRPCCAQPSGISQPRPNKFNIVHCRLGVQLFPVVRTIQKLVPNYYLEWTVNDNLERRHSGSFAKSKKYYL
jgi:hypothetical protein